MSQQTRTPRQQQGDNLTELMTRVPPDVYGQIAKLASDRQTTKAQIVRDAIDFYLHPPKRSA